jgi:excisionase family DNA binding protein
LTKALYSQRIASEVDEDDCGEEEGDMPRSRLRNDTQPEFYTVGQLAELLQLTPMTIYRMVSRGELACHAIGRIKRFRRGDVEAFLQKARRPTSG